MSNLICCPQQETTVNFLKWKLQAGYRLVIACTAFPHPSKANTSKSKPPNPTQDRLLFCWADSGDLALWFLLPCGPEASGGGVLRTP